MNKNAVQEMQPDQEGFLAGFQKAFKGFRQEKGGDPLGYLFIAPAILLFLVFQGYPIIRGMLMAFSDYRWLVPETQGLFALNGLDNFKMLLQDETFFGPLGSRSNTLHFICLYSWRSPLEQPCSSPKSAIHVWPPFIGWWRIFRWCCRFQFP